MNPVAGHKTGLEPSTLLLPTRIAAAVALAVSVGVFVLVALIAPDHGPTNLVASGRRGDRDRFVAKSVYEQTADLIPDCTFRLYEGKDHLGALFDKRTPGEILEFARP